MGSWFTDAGFGNIAWKNAYQFRIAGCTAVSEPIPVLWTIRWTPSAKGEALHSVTLKMERWPQPAASPSAQLTGLVLTTVSWQTWQSWISIPARAS